MFKDDRLKNKMGTLVKKIRNAFILGLAGVSAFIAGYNYFVPDTIVTTINETQVKKYNNKDKYLVFAEDGVFENTDAWYRLKFNSSDLQNKIMKLKNKKVGIDKYGWRFSPFSIYENIVGINEAE